MTGHRVLVGVTAGVAVALLGSGALSIADTVSLKTTKASTSLASPSRIDLNVDSGSITIRTDSTITRPQVQATYRTGFSKPTLTEADSGSTTTVNATCDWSLPWHSGRCSADVDLVLPVSGTVAVDAHTGSGSITVKGDLVDNASEPSSNGPAFAAGLTSNLTLSTGSGGIDVAGLAGTLDAHTGSGSVTVTDARSVAAQSDSGSVNVTNATDATAHAGSGPVTVRNATGNVTATSGSGSVTVYAGTDAKPVKLDISTGSGSRTVDAPTDPKARTSVTIRSGSGSVAYLGEN